MSCSIENHKLIKKCNNENECIKNKCYKIIKKNNKINYLSKAYVYKESNLHEIYTQIYASKYKLAPKIVSYYSKNKKYYFITKNLNSYGYHTLYELYGKYLSNVKDLKPNTYIEISSDKYMYIHKIEYIDDYIVVNNKYKITGNVIWTNKIPTKKIINNIYNSIKKLLFHNIYHGDLHGNNILYNEKTHKTLFIDFEFAKVSKQSILKENYSQLLKFKDYMSGSWNTNIIEDIPELFLIFYYNLNTDKKYLNKYYNKFKQSLPNMNY